MSFFPLLIYKIFLLSLVFSSIAMTYLSMDFIPYFLFWGFIGSMVDILGQI